MDEVRNRAYLAAHAAKQHERQFGWKNFRVLTVTTDERRMQTMMDALHQLRLPNGAGPSLFYFTTRDALGAGTYLTHAWKDGAGREVHLI